MRVEWTEQSLADLDDAFAYIDDRNPEAAHKFFRGMFKAVKALSSFPVTVQPGRWIGGLGTCT